MTKKRKKEAFNDLLLPILLVLCVMPFIVYLAEYSCGYSKYLWYSENDIISDLYNYYRCYFFEAVAVFTLIVLVFRIGLYKEKRKPWKMFLPLAVYGLMAVASTCFSVNTTASVSGNFYQFQSIFVILGYLVMCFYTYQVLEREKDYGTLLKGLAIAFCILLIIGIFQLFEQDLLNFSWVQRLIMSKEQFDIYQGEIETVFTGNNVFLTLFNPNYAGVFLTMLVCVFGVACWGERERRKKIALGILTVLAFVLMWFTYSRSTLVSLAAAAVVFLILMKKRTGKILKRLIPVLLVLLAALLLVDKLNGWKYMSRIFDEKRETLLKGIITTERGIELSWDDKTYRIAMEDGKAVVYGQDGQELPLEKGAEGDTVLPLEQPIHMTVLPFEDTEYLYLLADDQTFTFGWDASGYYYVNENGKQDQLVDIPKVDFGGYEYLGSGRLYIWSRVLPMLKDYLLTGSGPDTFAEVFPQNDYVGKAIYADTSARIMERPHNDYLLQWVQNGFVGMAGMLVFYLLLLEKGIRVYRGLSLDTVSSRLGMGCFLACISYMTGSLFNDSTLFTAPTFWVFAGIALSAAQQEQ